MKTDDPPSQRSPRNGGKYLEWALAAVAVVLVIIIVSGVQAQDAPPEPIRCAEGYCIMREQQLIEISRALASMRDQLEQYAKLCKWGTR